MTEFVIEFLGTLQDWYARLSEYEQLQYVQMKDLQQVIHILNVYFIEDPLNFIN